MLIFSKFRSSCVDWCDPTKAHIIVDVSKDMSELEMIR